MSRYFTYLLSSLICTWSCAWGAGLKINPQALTYQKDTYTSYETRGHDIHLSTESGKTWVICSLPHMPSNQKPESLIKEWCSGDPLDFISSEEAKLSPLCNRRTGAILFGYYTCRPKQQKIQQKMLHLAGERCSGTHFLQGIIENHMPKQALFIRGTDDGYIPHERHFPSWLHMPKKMFLCSNTREAAQLFDKAETPNRKLLGAWVAIVRDPYDWIRSFYNKKWYAMPILKDLSFSDFIRSQWICTNEEKDPFTGKWFETLFELRAAKMLCMLEAAKRHRHCVVCTYEELFKCPEKLLSYLANHMNIPVLPIFQSIQTVKNFKKQPFVPTKYQGFSQEDLDFINSRLDPCLEDLFGYKLIEEECDVPSNALENVSL